MSPFCFSACYWQVAISNSINGTLNPQNCHRAIMNSSVRGEKFISPSPNQSIFSQGVRLICHQDVNYVQ